MPYPHCMYLCTCVCLIVVAYETRVNGVMAVHVIALYIWHDTSHITAQTIRADSP